MNNNNKLLSSGKVLSSDKDNSLSKPEKSQLLLAQLLERNIANDAFINTFIIRVQKKYRGGKNGNTPTNNLTTCPEIL